MRWPLKIIEIEFENKLKNRKKQKNEKCFLGPRFTDFSIGISVSVFSIFVFHFLTFWRKSVAHGALDLPTGGMRMGLDEFPLAGTGWPEAEEVVSLAYRLRLNLCVCIFTFSQEMCVQYEISFLAES